MKFVTLITCISTFNSLKEVFKVIPIRNFNQPIKQGFSNISQWEDEARASNWKPILANFSSPKTCFLSLKHSTLPFGSSNSLQPESFIWKTSGISSPLLCRTKGKSSGTSWPFLSANSFWALFRLWNYENGYIDVGDKCGGFCHRIIPPTTFKVTNITVKKII